MLKIDKDYENAIRFLLDNMLLPPNKQKFTYRYDTNVAKKIASYIKDNSEEKDNYLFSTPLSCFWNFTSACNFRCVHCLYNDTEYSSENDLSHEEVLKLTDEIINDFGITFVALSGGEIFMRPDIIDVVRKLKENNVAVRLQTNAALINDKQIDEIAELFNPYTDSIHISVDGATHETFKKIRQTDLFEKITGNIKKLTSKGVRVMTVCTVNNINYNEVIDTYKLCADLGAYEFVAAKTNYHNESHKDLIVPDRDLFLLYADLIPQETEKLRLNASFFTPLELLNIPEVRQIIEEEKYQTSMNERYKKVYNRNCHSHDKLAIQSDGTIYLCLEALCKDFAPLGNYKQQSMAEIWENRHNNILFEKRDITKMQCNNCKYNKFCNSGCVIKSYPETHDINTPQHCDAYCC